MSFSLPSPVYLSSWIFVGLLLLAAHGHAAKAPASGSSNASDAAPDAAPGSLPRGAPDDVGDGVRDDVGDALAEAAFEEARQAFLDRNWDRAITLYTRASGDPALRERSLEMLGVAREKNGQLAHAKRVYQQVLEEYPESAAARRTEQRLNSLLGVEEAPRELRKTAARRPWNAYGHISQFYRRHSIDIDGIDRRVPIDAVFSDVTALATRRTASGFHEARLSLGHVLDTGSDGYGTARALRVQRLYWESFFERLSTGFAIGRQSRHQAGVLGRFDGLTLSHEQNDAVQWNAVAGLLVDSSFDGVDDRRPFYGVSADIRLFDEHLEISPFLIQQYRDEVLDRRALGAHVFWLTDRSMVTALLDYDFYHQALNNIYLTGSYNLTPEWRIHGAVDFRRSPYLTTSNALIGQGLDDLSELEQLLVEHRLGDVAADRTATSKLVRLGIDGALNARWSLSADVSASHYSATDGSVGVFGSPERSDVYLTTQVRATDLFVRNSYTALQMRYHHSDTSSGSSVYLTQRFRMGEHWLVYPRLMAATRTSRSNDQEQMQVRPSLRLDYEGFERFRLEAEVGYDWSVRETLRDDLEMRGLFLRIGYRAMLRR